MKYYVFVELDVTDQSWVQAYVQNVTPLVEQAGGKYLARTSTIEKLEGDRQKSQLVVLIEWPSKEAAVSFYQSKQYEPYLKSRLRGAHNELMLFAGEDIATSQRDSR
ncbi:MAG: DUF1330 domain-containing protein [Acidobacteria bacterium]|nr:DUF1330 domain-containing protein [Acidobacteriota bacterium]